MYLAPFLCSFLFVALATKIPQAQTLMPELQSLLTHQLPARFPSLRPAQAVYPGTPPQERIQHAHETLIREVHKVMHQFNQSTERLDAFRNFLHTQIDA